MSKQKLGIKVVTILVLVLLAFAISSGSGVDAKGLGRELWGIDWASNAKQITKVFEKQGFSTTEQGQDADSRWLRFVNGRFLEYPCEVRARWVADDLREVVIYLAEKGPKTATNYRDLMQYFNKYYGMPAATDLYYMKRYPPIKVEAASWKVSGEGTASFEIHLTRMGTERYLDAEPDDSRVEVTIIKHIK